MSIQHIIAYHKALADLVAPLYGNLQSFTTGILARVGKSDKLATTIYGGYDKSLEWLYWVILSELDNILCEQVPADMPLRFSEFYVDRTDTISQIWHHDHVKQRGVKYQFTEDDMCIVDDLWRNIETIMNVIKTACNRDLGSPYKLSMRVLEFETKVAKVKLAFNTYTNHTP
jgi:hypothetical protein